MFPRHQEGLGEIDTPNYRHPQPTYVELLVQMVPLREKEIDQNSSEEQKIDGYINTSKHRFTCGHIKLSSGVC